MGIVTEKRVKFPARSILLIHAELGDEHALIAVFENFALAKDEDFDFRRTPETSAAFDHRHDDLLRLFQIYDKALRDLFGSVFGRTVEARRLGVHATDERTRHNHKRKTHRPEHEQRRLLAEPALRRFWRPGQVTEGAMHMFICTGRVPNSSCTPHARQSVV